MADPTPAPAPPPATPPNPWYLLLQAIAPMMKNEFFHTFLTAVLSVWGTLYMAKSQLGELIPPEIKPLLPKLWPQPKKAEDAIGRLTIGNVGCTGTIIGPVRSDDAKIQILTAAHCVKVGAVGSMKLRDGRTFPFRCVSRDADADAAWLEAAMIPGQVPYLLLADAPPEKGEAVWHQGFGIDKPGNRESGKFLALESRWPQCRFRMSVSPGDSGGGIIMDAESKVVSPVCCTTKLSGMGDVWGASPAAIKKIRPSHTSTFEEPPLIYPILPLPDAGDWHAEPAPSLNATPRVPPPPLS